MSHTQQLLRVCVRVKEGTSESLQSVTWTHTCDALLPCVVFVFFFQLTRKEKRQQRKEKNRSSKPAPTASGTQGERPFDHNSEERTLPAGGQDSEKRD